MLDAILLCPKNDEESLLILKIAERAGISVVVSVQSHGARLENEAGLVDRLRAASSVSAVAIVEIPGPIVENQLRAAGYDVTIIDHHRYEGLDRSAPKSSLEQFLEVFAITDEKLVSFGFDPALVAGIGALDQGFVHELAKRGIIGDARRRAIEYYIELGRELGGESEASVEAARVSFEAATMIDGVLVVHSTNPGVPIRQAVSFCIINNYQVAPPAIIVEGPARVSVQDSDRASALFVAFGGYMFGGGRCWGKQAADNPTVEEILSIMLEKAA